jgi:hypothetical protein
VGLQEMTLHLNSYYSCTIVHRLKKRKWALHRRNTSDEMKIVLAASVLACPAPQHPNNSFYELCVFRKKNEFYEIIH